MRHVQAEVAGRVSGWHTLTCRAYSGFDRALFARPAPSLRPNQDFRRARETTSLKAAKRRVEQFSRSQCRICPAGSFQVVVALFEREDCGRSVSEFPTKRELLPHPELKHVKN